MTKQNLIKSKEFLAMHNEAMCYQILDSPIGQLHIFASDKGLKDVSLKSKSGLNICENEHTHLAVEELKHYFDGQLRVFTVSLDLGHYTPFQQRIWQLLQEIPYGTTVSYRDLSIRYGDIKAIRAVGTANGRNPIPIIVPCHRLIGSDGSLTGYALGLDIKSQLLTLENPQKFGIKQTSLSF